MVGTAEIIAENNYALVKFVIYPHGKLSSGKEYNLAITLKQYRHQICFLEGYSNLGSCIFWCSRGALKVS